jgi:diguanylate cyclase (GGDEF)-like protein
LTTGQLLIVALLLQQGLLGMAWMSVAAIGLSRRAALAWGAAAWLLALGCVSLLMRAELGLWVGTLAPNLLALLAFLAVRRGIRSHAQSDPGDRAQALLLAGTATVLAIAVGSGDQGPAWPWIMGVTSIAYGLTLIGASLDAVRLFGPRHGQLSTALCAAPVMVLGLLFLLRALSVVFTEPQSLATTGHFNRADIALGLAFLAMGLLLNLSLAALVTQGVMRSLHDLTLRDPLTGLLNRRGMGQAMAAEDERLRRAPLPGAVLMIDIDHFKRINDQHGHAAGDAVIHAVAAAIQGQLREVDRVARMGGEEFAALLVGASPADAQAVAARVLATVQALQVPWGDERLRVTVSIGVSSATRRAEQTAPALSTLLQPADAALYAAKARGRNRIVTWPVADPAPGATNDQALRADPSANLSGL